MQAMKMKAKLIGITGTAVMSALLGFGAHGLAAQDHHEAKQDAAKPEQHAAQTREQPTRQAQSKPEQRATQTREQPTRQAQSKPEQRAAQPREQPARQEQIKPQQRPHDASVPQQRQAQTRQMQDRQQNTQQARGNDRSPERHVQQSAWQQHRASNWQADHRTWTERGGYRGYRIPDERFRGAFGSDHDFRIGGLPFLVVGGYPRFQYGGYWFSMVDPYPGSWANNWYDTDDVYVSYADNGYYLYNSRYPGVGIAISVSM